MPLKKQAMAAAKIGKNISILDNHNNKNPSNKNAILATAPKPPIVLPCSLLVTAFEVIANMLL